MEEQGSLPGASNALTFGILSIVITLFCCGPFGAIFGFLGLNSAKRAERAHRAQPQAGLSGIENAKTGKVLSYIGLAIAAVLTILAILYFGALVAIFMTLVAEGNL
ncbi:hypothetical protein [Maribacter sp. 2307ULW6-5]|uniref:hypothetical protein n=1 Tax=Maribacter sp. 2307ULW6-5 TaxID=3386275 RepID=UPI0039BCBC95